MINPVSSQSSNVQSAQQVAPKNPATPSSQSAAPASTQDTVDLSPRAQATLSGTGSTSNQSASGYAPPSTVQAHSSRGKAAS